MMKHTFPAILALALIAASPSVEPQSLIRRANGALQAKRWREAIELYSKAEKTTTDPGFVAYNKALALYQIAKLSSSKERLREAGEHFNSCLTDRDRSRRARAWHGKGNCLLLAGSSKELTQAIDCYRECIALNVDEELTKDARYNLELARQLLPEVKKREQEDPEPPDVPEPKPKKDEDEPKKDDQPKKDGGDSTQGSKKKPTPGSDKKPKDGQNPTKSGQGGKLPPKQQRPLQKLSVQQALEQLQKAAKQVKDERRRYRIRTAREAMGEVKDW